MTPLLDRINLTTPPTLADALALLGADRSARPFAGGTDLMVLLEAGHLPEGSYVNLWGVDGLRGIEETPEAVTVGAMTTYTDMRRSHVLARAYPLLPTAASEIGGVATQNRGTIGGNIANASPAADTPPALLVYDAELELLTATASRRVPYDRFHQGYKKMDLRRGEIIARIRLPHRTDGWRDYYRKVGTRRAQAISKVCLAGSIFMDGPLVRDVRIAVASVAPTVVRCTRAEEALHGRPLSEDAIRGAQAALLDDISPIDDIRSTAEYRRRVAQNLLRECLRP